MPLLSTVTAAEVSVYLMMKEYVACSIVGIEGQRGEKAFQRKK